MCSRPKETDRNFGQSPKEEGRNQEKRTKGGTERWMSRELDLSVLSFRALEKVYLPHSLVPVFESVYLSVAVY